MSPFSTFELSRTIVQTTFDNGFWTYTLWNTSTDFWRIEPMFPVCEALLLVLSKLDICNRIAWNPVNIWPLDTLRLTSPRPLFLTASSYSISLNFLSPDTLRPQKCWLDPKSKQTAACRAIKHIHKSSFLVLQRKEHDIHNKLIPWYRVVCG